MANFVIKKDGSKEPFDAEKVKRSIAAAAKEANLEEGRINEVVEQVSGSVFALAEGKEEIATSELREKILAELDILEPAVSEVWRKYDEARGRA